MLGHLRARTPLFFGLLILLVGIFAAEYWDLYHLVPHLDKLLHVLGGIVVGWLALAFLQDDIVRLSGWKQALIIVSVACLVGVLWEFAEFAADFSPVWLYHWFHGGDLADTMGDLASDVGGGLIFALWALRKERS